jgi:hypothetical protein
MSWAAPDGFVARQLTPKLRHASLAMMAGKAEDANRHCVGAA